MSIISEIINPFLTVRKQIKDRGVWVDEEKKRENMMSAQHWNQTIQSGTSVTVINNFNRKIIIDVLEYGNSLDDESKIVPRLFHRVGGSSNYDYELFHVVRGSIRGFATYDRLETAKSPLLEYVESESGISHKVMNKREIVLPEGCLLEFVNISDDSATLRYKIVWREIDK